MAGRPSNAPGAAATSTKGNRPSVVRPVLRPEETGPQPTRWIVASQT
jgi:hypothetical protein